LPDLNTTVAFSILGTEARIHRSTLTINFSLCFCLQYTNARAVYVIFCVESIRGAGKYASVTLLKRPEDSLHVVRNKQNLFGYGPTAGICVGHHASQLCSGLLIMESVLLLFVQDVGIGKSTGQNTLIIFDGFARIVSGEICRGRIKSHKSFLQS